MADDDVVEALAVEVGCVDRRKAEAVENRDRVLKGAVAVAPIQEYLGVRRDDEVPGGTEVDDLNDIRVANRAGDPRLALEPADAPGSKR